MVVSGYWTNSPRGVSARTTRGDQPLCGLLREDVSRTGIRGRPGRVNDETPRMQLHQSTSRMFNVRAGQHVTLRDDTSHRRAPDQDAAMHEFARMRE